MAPVLGTGYSRSCAGVNSQLYFCLECSAGTNVSRLPVQPSSTCIDAAVLYVQVVGVLIWVIYCEHQEESCLAFG